MKCRFAVLAATLALAGAVHAEPMEDVDYVRIPAHPVAEADKIEVIEFFHYGCGACNRFEPHLRAWLATLPADVSFRRIPALKKSDRIPLARLFYALDALGQLDRLHASVFRALHDENLDLGDGAEILAWAQRNGMDAAEFERVLISDAIAIRVQQARDATIAYGIRVTPSLVVEGKYLTSGAMVGSLDALVPILNGLTERVRRERAKP